MAEIPKCNICKKDMRCIRNGCEVIFNQQFIIKHSGKVFNRFPYGLECGAGDLFHCKKCKTYVVDGFNILVKGAE